MHTLAHIIGGLSTIIMSLAFWFLLGEDWFGGVKNKEGLILFKIIGALLLAVGIYQIVYPFDCGKLATKVSGCTEPSKTIRMNRISELICAAARNAGI